MLAERGATTTPRDTIFAGGAPISFRDTADFEEDTKDAMLTVAAALAVATGISTTAFNLLIGKIDFDATVRVMNSEPTCS